MLHIRFLLIQKQSKSMINKKYTLRSFLLLELREKLGIIWIDLTD